MHLPDLPYATDALEPFLDAETLEVHHAVHHDGHVRALDLALGAHPELAERSLAHLLLELESVPGDIREAVRKHGGGHTNHSLFWICLSPDAGGTPDGALLEGIRESFGGFTRFRDVFTAAALDRFGSGWAWLSIDDRGALVVESTPNEESPLLEGRQPIVGLDLWEHAYDRRYRGRREDYVAAWWDFVDWENAGRRFETAARDRRADTGGRPDGR